MTGETQRVADDFEAGRFLNVPDDIADRLDEALNAQDAIREVPVDEWAEKLTEDLLAAPPDTGREREHG